MLTAIDKQTTGSSILMEVTLDKKYTKITSEIYSMGIVPVGNRFKLV